MPPAREGVFEVSKTFPEKETYSLTDQIRRSSRSIGGQIAEAWARRRSEKPWVSKLTDADGEKDETVPWLITANDSGYLSNEAVDDFIDRYGSVHRMLESMISKSDLFCTLPGKPRF